MRKARRIVGLVGCDGNVVVHVLFFRRGRMSFSSKLGVFMWGVCIIRVRHAEFVGVCYIFFYFLFFEEYFSCLCVSVDVWMDFRFLYE